MGCHMRPVTRVSPERGSGSALSSSTCWDIRCFEMAWCASLAGRLFMMPLVVLEQKRPALFWAGRWTCNLRGATYDCLVRDIRSACAAHAFGDDADLLDARALRGVDDLDDLAVPQRAGADDEHRLVLGLVQDVPQARLELLVRHVLVVDRDLLVGRVVDDDLADVRCHVRRLLALCRQVDVDALLRQRQGRHEDDEEHEQHVDERRDVHVRAGVQRLALDDLVGTEMMVCVSHYLPPAAPSAPFLRSVMRPMSSMPACRSWSIAVMTAPYSTSSSALMRTIFSFLFSSSSLSRVVISDS